MKDKVYNIYCDETCHLQHDNIKPMGLGSVWCPKEKRLDIFKKLRQIKEQYGIKPHCELKWNAVSNSKLEYYKAVVNYFFENSDLHFRALIVTDKSKLNHEQFNQTHDDFYYKMYFRLLKTIINPEDTYEIYIDIKDTKSEQKVQMLRSVISNSNYDFDQTIISRIQQVVSGDVELIQLADFLIGAIVYYQRGLSGNAAKREVIELLKQRSGYSLTKSTLYKEDKFNLFFFNPQV